MFAHWEWEIRSALRLNQAMQLESAIDINAVRQRCYLLVIGLLIVSQRDGGARGVGSVVVTNPNCIREIKSVCRSSESTNELIVLT